MGEIPHLTTNMDWTPLFVKELTSWWGQPLYRLTDVGWIKRSPDRIDLAALVRPHQAAAKIAQRFNLHSRNHVGQGSA
jgi:hypothetical protein